MRGLSNIGFLFLSFGGARGTFLAMKKYAMPSSQTFLEDGSDCSQLKNNVEKAQESVRTAEGNLQEAYAVIYEEFKQAEGMTKVLDDTNKALLSARADLTAAEYEKARGKVPKSEANARVKAAKDKLTAAMEEGLNDFWKTLPKGDKDREQEDLDTKKEELRKLSESLVTADRNNAIAKAALDRCSARNLNFYTARQMEEVFEKTQDSSQSNGTSKSISVRRTEDNNLEVTWDAPGMFGNVGEVLYRIVEIQGVPQKAGESINGVWFRRLPYGDYERVSWNMKEPFLSAKGALLSLDDLKKLHEEFEKAANNPKYNFPIDVEQLYDRIHKKNKRRPN